MIISKKKLNTLIEEAVRNEREKHEIQEQFNELYRYINDLARSIDERFEELKRVVVVNTNN